MVLLKAHYNTARLNRYVTAELDVVHEELDEIVCFNM